MRSRRCVRTRVAALALGATMTALAATAAPAVDAAASAPPSPAVAAPDMPPETLAEYLQTYPDVPVATLYARLRLLPARLRLLRRWGAEHAATFGGSRYDFRTGVWHVAATDERALRSLEADGRAAGAVVQARLVRHSLRTLEERADRIRGGRDPLSAVSRVAGVDVERNLVKLAAPLARRTPGDPMVTYVDPPAPRERLVEQVNCSSRRNCGVPLRTGVILWKGSYANPWCSLGFAAAGTDGSKWAITAGHCIDDTSDGGELWGHGYKELGSIIGPSWCAITRSTPQCADTTNTDVARIKITNPYWLSGGFGYIFGNPDPTLPSTVDVDDAMEFRYEMEVGQVVCLHAWHKNHTGFPSTDPYDHDRVSIDTCGTISETISLEHGMPRVINVEVCKGDSGGGWAMNPGGGLRYAWGIHSGGTNEADEDPMCSNGESAWFTPIATANAFFDTYSSLRIRVITR